MKRASKPFDISQVDLNSTASVTNVIVSALDAPIAFHRAFALIAGDACSGLFLSQSWYWSRRTKPVFSWFWKTMEDWEDETCLTRSEQERARKRLISLGLLSEERRGIPARLHFRLNLQAIISAIAKIDDPVCRKQAIQFVENQQTGLQETSKLYKEAEITTETTTESTSDISSAEGGRDEFKLYSEDDSYSQYSLHYKISKEIQRWFKQENNFPCPWDGAEARLLKQLLDRCPKVEEHVWFTAIANRFKSDVNHAENPRKWIGSLLQYSKGPLNEYGKPKEQPRRQPEAKSAQDELKRQGAYMPLRGSK